MVLASLIIIMGFNSDSMVCSDRQDSNIIQDTMQILSSPTRKEVDRAHSKKQWLDIGIPSTRNLRAISGKRILMWIALAFSSIPLHLM